MQDKFNAVSDRGHSASREEKDKKNGGFATRRFYKTDTLLEVPFFIHQLRGSKS